MALILDIPGAQKRFEQYANPILSAFAESGIATGEQITPPMIVDALRQLFTLLATEVASWDPALPDDEPERIGDLTIGLLMDLATWADRLGERQAKTALEMITVSIAAWVCNQHGAIHTLEPIVNGLAILANSRVETDELRSLAQLMGQVKEAASADYATDLDGADPRRPWRILLLNWGITATRAQDPAEMRSAFAALLRHLPVDAALFFQEGRQQVAQGDFPDEVRTVMEEAAEGAGRSLRLH
ncbi:hypothetical protein ACSDBR_07785 [Acidithiobacillus ferriphilus]|uniref:hypothetical protein n=1 Tax=Acidithiobacillus ferriphilus TaxID=1689834 RepID=UPI003F519135